jgi:uncharacterized peroxidase-related enzyme
MNKAISSVTSMANPAARETLDAVRDRVGFVPILFASLARQPGVVESFVALDDAFSATTLSPVERQVVLLTASVENNGVYCVAGHSLFGRSIGVPEQAIEAIRSDSDVDDPRLAALRTFVAKLVRNRGHVESGDIEQLTTAGYSRHQMLEIIMGVTLKTFSNFVDSAMKLPLDAAFEPAAWSTPRASTCSARIDTEA